MVAAKLAYRPVGMLASIAAGSIASAVFRVLWRRIAHEDEAPQALQAENALGKIVLAAALEGAIFAVVRALIDRGGARAFQKITGTWPGDD
jgi:Protein of unknown function (DUF4235)